MRIISGEILFGDHPLLVRIFLVTPILVRIISGETYPGEFRLGEDIFLVRIISGPFISFGEYK